MFDTADEVFAHICKNYGMDVLTNKSRFLGLFADFAPTLQREKKIIGLAFDEGVHKILLEANHKAKQEKEIAVKKSIKLLVDEAFVVESAAHLIVNCFIVALDWDIVLEQTAKAVAAPTARGASGQPNPKKAKQKNQQKKQISTEQKRFCKNCGTNVSITARFCKSCGITLKTV